jgi:hypothetical protein
MPLAKVFISYRRDDSAGHAGRVHDWLAHEFGANLVFMDVDSIPLGSDFIKVLRRVSTKKRCQIESKLLRRWLADQGIQAVWLSVENDSDATLYYLQPATP